MESGSLILAKDILTLAKRLAGDRVPGFEQDFQQVAEAWAYALENWGYPAVIWPRATVRMCSEPPQAGFRYSLVDLRRAARSVLVGDPRLRGLWRERLERERECRDRELDAGVFAARRGIPVRGVVPAVNPPKVTLRERFEGVKRGETAGEVL